MIKKNKKIELSLSALMFFSPLIKRKIKTDQTIDEIDKEFIQGYILIGFLNIVLLIIAIIAQVSYFLTKVVFFQSISLIFSIILGIILTFGAILAFNEKSILKLKNTEKEKISNQKLIEYILYYLPVYNIYIWYKKHNFNDPDVILKESIIIWTIFTVILLISNNINIIVIMFVVLVFRVLALSQGVFYGENSIKKINTIFKKNPEEIWAYLKGPIISLWNKKSIIENIKTNKLEFELIPKITDKEVIFQYLLLVGIFIIFIYLGIINKNTNLLLACFIIFGRYLVMFIKWEHSPNLPIIKELSNLFFKNKNEKQN